MSEDAAHTEDALEEEARQRGQEIAAGEEASAQAVAAAEQGPSPDAEIAQVPRSGRQHDLSDTAPYHRPRRSTVASASRAGRSLP
jgi:hypothetical protein